MINVHRYTGTQVHRYTGMYVQMYIGRRLHKDLNMYNVMNKHNITRM